MSEVPTKKHRSETWQEISISILTKRDLGIFNKENMKNAQYAWMSSVPDNDFIFPPTNTRILIA
jgi:hypothetical protein